MEEALRESEQRFRDIVRSLGDWVWEVDTAALPHLFLAADRGPPGVHGGGDAREVPGPQRRPGGPRPLSRRQEALLRHPEPFRDREVWHLHRDGHRVCLSVSGVPVFDAGGVLRGFRGVAHDVTERLREEAEVQQARRVESLGVLAGGIAHDFNNLLTAILGNAELALAELPEGAAARPLDRADPVGRPARRRAHAPDAGLRRPGPVRDPAGRPHHRRPRNGAAARRLDPEEGGTRPRPRRRAPGGGGGPGPAAAAGDEPGHQRRRGDRRPRGAHQRAHRRRRTRGPVPTRTSRSARSRPAGAQVCVEIADSGHGIAPEALAKIFDPFFTTKFTGRGLGLAAVQGIVLRHGGTIAVSSAPGAGSTFRVCFPACAPGTAQAAPPPHGGTGARRGGGAPWRGSGTILLVDDEAPVRTHGDAHAAGPRVRGPHGGRRTRGGGAGARRRPRRARCCST